MRGLVTLLDALLVPALDDGSKDFQPTNLEITSVDVGNPSANVIASKATAAFNIRFNDNWSAETLQAEIHNRLDRAADRRLRIGAGSRIARAAGWMITPTPSAFASRTKSFKLFRQ